MRIRYTGYGKKELTLIGCIAVLAAAAFWLLFPGLEGAYKILFSFVVLGAGFTVSLFFRSPDRPLPPGDEDLLAPADGKIVDITDIPGGTIPFFGEEVVVRIGIFLSLYNVHVNRAPCRLRVDDTLHVRGRHITARRSESSSENESCTIFARAAFGTHDFPLSVKQISGAVARRIVCSALPGDTIEKGIPFGMIKFGSRTELFIPGKRIDELKVAIGDKVKAGLSPLASIK